MPTQVILLERVENLGAMGDVVAVKPGYARNYLLPHHKAMRATKENIAYFETQKANLEKANAAKRKEAEKLAASLEGISVVVIRQASEGGQLYGSVSSRDIAEAVSTESGQTIGRSMVVLNQAFKTIGLFDVVLTLHPEVKVSVKVNIARSADEAKLQAKTGKAVISAEAKDEGADDRASKAAFLEDEALAAEAAQAEEDASRDAEESAKSEARKTKRASKKAAKAEDEGEDAEEAPAEDSDEE